MLACGAMPRLQARQAAQKNPMQIDEGDTVAWANEQARLSPAGQFDLLDIQH